MPVYRHPAAHALPLSSVGWQNFFLSIAFVSIAPRAWRVQHVEGTMMQIGRDWSGTYGRTRVSDERF